MFAVSMVFVYLHVYRIRIRFCTEEFMKVIESARILFVNNGPVNESIVEPGTRRHGRISFRNRFNQIEPAISNRVLRIYKGSHFQIVYHCHNN